MLAKELQVPAGAGANLENMDSPLDQIPDRQPPGAPILHSASSLGPAFTLPHPGGAGKLLSQLGENHPPPVSGADHHPYLINPLPTILITLVRLQQEPPPLDGCPSNFHPLTP